MEARAAELLPVEYFHVVFTLPDVFNQLALGNKRVVYRTLFKAVAQTLLEVAANPIPFNAHFEKSCLPAIMEMF
jgi:hypothetical protein